MGNDLLDRVMQILNDHIDDQTTRESIYIDLIPLFEEDLVAGLLDQDDAFDTAYRRVFDEKAVDKSILGMFDDESD